MTLDLPASRVAAEVTDLRYNYVMPQAVAVVAVAAAAERDALDEPVGRFRRATVDPRPVGS